MRRIYNFKKDPTTPSHNKLWFEGYNIDDDVFRSVLLSHIIQCNHNIHEREFGGNIYEFPIECGDCGKRTVFKTNGKRTKTIKSILCEECKPHYKNRKKNIGYMKMMTNKMFEINEAITDSIIKKIDKK